jgi:hypothetical protein
MHGAIPQFPCVFMAWDLIKHRDNLPFSAYVSKTYMNALVSYSLKK